MSKITSDEIKAIVSKHNTYRNKYNVTQMLSSTNEMNELSQKRADTISSTNIFAHEVNLPYGENLWATTNPDAEISSCVDSWMSESYSWIENENNWYPALGHFSQCLWKDSSQIGCAKGTFTNKDNVTFYFVVCNYNPPGNIIGERPYDP